MVFLQSPELVDPILSEIKQLRLGHEDDFWLLKYLVKTVCGYKLSSELSIYDSVKLRARINDVRPLERELAQKHSYSKYLAHLDFLEVSEL